MLGVGISAYPAVTFSEPFTPGVFYGALRVHAQFDDSFKLLRGAPARSFLEKLRSVFGKEVTSFSVVVEVTLPDGTRMPPIHALIASYDSSEGRWNTAIAEQLTMTPWIHLDSANGFRYSIKYVAAESGEVMAFSNIVDVVGQVAEIFPGSWAFNKAAVGTIDKVGREFEHKISTAFIKKSYVAEATTEANPYAARWSGRTYQFYDFRNMPVARISLTVPLKRSLVVGEETRENDVPADPPVFTNANPREVLRSVNNDARRLDAELRQEGFYATLVTPPDVAQFTRACRSFDSWLVGKGLNTYDRVAFAYKVLTTDTPYHKADYATDCFAAERELFRRLFPGQAVGNRCPGGAMNQRYADAVGEWWVSKGARRADDITACLSPAVLLDRAGSEGASLASAVIGQLASLDVDAGAERTYGLWRMSPDERGGFTLTVPWCERNKVVYETDLVSSAASGGLIDTVRVRRNGAATASACRAAVKTASG